VKHIRLTDEQDRTVSRSLKKLQRGSNGNGWAVIASHRIYRYFYLHFFG
jgi:hypothetical protein